MFANVMCLILPMCISSLISVKRPLLVCAFCLCVWWCSGVFLVFSCVSVVSCIVMRYEVF